MIIDIIKYFAKFPLTQGVMKNFTSGDSRLAGYQQLMNEMADLPERELLPDIKDYVFALDIDQIKRRLNDVDGVFLMLDLGNFSSSRDSRNSIKDVFQMAVTVAQKTSDSLDFIEKALVSDAMLQLVNQLRAHLSKDKALSPWNNLLSDSHDIVPFDAPTLQSEGWTIMLQMEGSDMLEMKELVRTLNRSL